MGQSLCRLSSLEKLTLKFSLPYMVTREGLEFLLKSLKRLRSLSSFSLTLIEWSGLKRAFASLCKAIGDLVPLESLKLEISPDVGFSSLGELLKSRKNKLKTFGFRFRSYNPVMDEELEDFSQDLKETGALETLSLDLSGHRELTDLSLGFISEGFSKSEKIQNLSLNFQDVTE